ncbi:aldehyde dehydrogenase family protein [Sphingorhabdus lutea]|nr:aldehyde dehydrogenase family protein [Sphingorhabdus lutea]
MKIINPRTGKADYEITPIKDDALKSLTQKMRDAQYNWAARKVEERGAILEKLALSIEKHGGDIAAALTLDTGRRKISVIEVDGTAKLLRRWAANAPEIIAAAKGRENPTSVPNISTKTALRPYALIGVISPWNFPLTLALIDAVPALMAGCAVIIKPSEITPRFIAPLLTAIEDVPELRDILCVVEGDGQSGAAMIKYVDYIAFTGSVATGQKVGMAAAEAFIPASLELGGKDPMIILASADPKKAASIALRASIVNSGQACQSIERVYVAKEIIAPFMDALIAQAEAVELNYPDINKGHIGPFIFGKQGDIVQAQLDDAVKKGAEIYCGGTVETLGGGKYLRPTIIGNISSQMDIVAEETFGPVIPVRAFDNIDEAVMMANHSKYGLSGAVIAGSLDEAEAVGRRLNVGGVSLNDGSLTSMIWEAEKSSFGLSGIGASRMGDSGILRFFRRQAIILQGGEAAPIAAFAENGT